MIFLTIWLTGAIVFYFYHRYALKHTFDTWALLDKIVSLVIGICGSWISVLGVFLAYRSDLKEKKTITIYHNNNEVTIANPKYGIDLYKSLGEDHNERHLWRKSEIGDDKLIEPTELLDLKSWGRFYSAPKSINAG